jgi:hypothetical protein
MSAIRTFLHFLGFHQHAWGTWYESTVYPGRVVQTCYGCGKDRVVKVRFE